METSSMLVGGQMFMTLEKPLLAVLK